MIAAKRAVPVGSVLVVLLGLLIALPANSFHALQGIDDGFNLLDGSWYLDIPSRMAYGKIDGRDFIFTQGPLFQWTHALGLWIPPGNLASLMRFAEVLNALGTLVCAWFLLRLLGAPAVWRWIAFIAIAVMGGYGLRPMAGIVVMAAAAVSLSPHSLPSRRRWAGALALWAFAPPLLAAYSFDMGLMTLGAMLILALLVSALTLVRREKEFAIPRRALLFACVTLLGTAAGFAAISRFPGWEEYLRDCWDTAHGYSYMMAVPIAEMDLHRLVLAFLCAASVLLFLAAHARKAWLENRRIPLPTLAILGTALFALLWTRYGLSRSDTGHVEAAMMPTILVSTMLLPCWLRVERYRLVPALLLLSLPYALLCRSGITSVPRPLSGVPTAAGKLGRIEAGPARLRIDNSVLHAAAAMVHPLPQKQLYVWPFETVTCLVTGKESVGYTVQAYAAHTAYLERQTIDRIDRHPDVPVLFFTPGPLDRVEHLSRTPDVFRYLLDRYQLQQYLPARDTQGAVALLERRTDTAPRWRSLRLPVSHTGFAPIDNGVFFNGARLIPRRDTRPPRRPRFMAFDLPATGELACRASDFLVLRLRCAKTSTIPVGKPGQIFAAFYLDSGKVRYQKLMVLPDGKPHDILVSAATIGGHPLLLSAFSADRMWRARERIVRIEVQWSALDRFSRVPARIDLLGAFVLRRTPVRLLETPLDDRSEESIRWCYGSISRSWDDLLAVTNPWGELPTSTARQ